MNLRTSSMTCRGNRARLQQRLLGVWLLLLCGLPVLALDCPPLALREGAVPDSGGYSRGVLWKITAANGKHSTLFGTIHLGDPRVTAIPSVVTARLLAADSFSMEVLLDFDTLLRLSALMYYDDGTRLEQLAGGELFARTVELLAPYGVSAVNAARLKPWAAYTTLSLPPGQNATPLDLVLLTTAQQAHKRVYGLETLEEQASVFAGLTVTDQIALLKEVVCHYAEMQGDTEALLAAYTARDLAGLLKLTNQYDSKAQDELMRVLVAPRNQRMVERMLPRLTEGAAFIAIGALHLPGPDGVLALLARRGFKLTPLY